MPDIRVSSQIFDIAFDPTRHIVYGALLSGEVKAFSYDEQGAHHGKFDLKLSRRSCRSLDVSADGDRLWAVGKSKALYTVDTSTAVISQTKKNAHDAAINRIKRLTPNLLSTGDDDGIVKLWDPRKPDAVNTYAHHFDFISDFLWLEDKKHLVCTSGDGTLSVLDVRSKKTEPFAQSEDQEDELLSVVSIKGGQKLVIGTQLGILSIFNRRSGYSDCVDRIPGHPHSIDALCTIPSRYPNAESTILTGSSDGLVRVVEIMPSKLVGVVADHGEFPVERVKVDMGGEGNWVASVGHEEVLKLTDLREVFEDEDDPDEGKEDSAEEHERRASLDEDAKENGAALTTKTARASDADSDESSEEDEDADDDPEEVVAGAGGSDADSDTVTERRKRKKKDHDPFKASKKSKGRNELEADSTFFADL
ncbi:WD repeat-containing protein JIP5 [Cytidiella melzeri]|nr:WD repeat-containing protein JIP5 [Cytidiella melzeri]